METTASAAIIEKINTAKKTAEIIEQHMGKEFFTIEQYRSRMGIENPRSKKIEKMSWNEAKVSLQNLALLGHIEYANSVQENFNKNMFRVRLDNEFVMNHYQKQLDDYWMKLNEAKFAMTVIDGTYKDPIKTDHSKSDQKKESKPVVKKAVKPAAKKVVKKAVKKPANARKR